jgi:hypothetical protein
MIQKISVKYQARLTRRVLFYERGAKHPQTSCANRLNGKRKKERKHVEPRTKEVSEKQTTTTTHISRNNSNNQRKKEEEKKQNKYY